MEFTLAKQEQFVAFCTAASLMCPVMRLSVAFLRDSHCNGFDFISLLASWLELMCSNLPFAFFTQLFFIRLTVRTLFEWLFRKDIAVRTAETY